MASNDPEIKDGFTLPVWMKTKPVKEFEPFAASPPPAEDSFFFIRYPQKDTFFGKTENELPNIQAQQKGPELASGHFNSREKDWSKHTKPCQEVLHTITPINTAVNSQKPKSAGIDDGFKGEGAACGSSILKVASDMVSAKRSPRGFTVASPSEEELSIEAASLRGRRGSRSLPATPAHSPPGSPTRRRRNPNRYFTSPFEPVEDGSGRSWLTMALLGFKKDLTTSTSTLAEEDAIDNRLHGSLAESVESLGPAPRARESSSTAAEPVAPSHPAKPGKPPTFRPKPSELREMNFWSPTSM